VRFVLALGGIVLFLAGALLIIAGSSGAFSLDAVGLPAEAPGLVVLLLGVYTFFRSGREVRGDGRDDDPESHLAFTRDVRDSLDSLHDDDPDHR
jgi:hypothetical protein